MTALTALEQAAVNFIAANNQCGAKSKDYLVQDNMTWFNINDLMTGLGWTRHQAAGVMSALNDKALASDTEAGAKVRYDRDTWALTEKGIMASNLGEVVAAPAASAKEWTVKLTFAHPAHDEVNGISFTVVAGSGAEAIKLARKQARNDGHLPATGKGRCDWRARKA